MVWIQLFLEVLLQMKTLFTLPLGICLFSTAVLFGDLVDQVGDNDTSRQNWNDTGADWSDGLPASSGNDYASKGHILRTTMGVSSVFAGTTLTMGAGSQLQLRQGDGNTATVSDLTLNGGSVIAQTSAGIVNLAGDSLTVSGGTADFRIDDKRGVNLRFSELIGDGILEFDRAVNGADITDNSVNFLDAGAFTGTFSVKFGDLNFLSQGTGDFSKARLEVNNSTFATGSITLSRAVAFDSFKFSESPTDLAPGVYDVGELNRFSGEESFFGSGTLTVVP
jgi:hypothetical protein